jgi:hypothetical protein
MEVNRETSKSTKINQFYLNNKTKMTTVESKYKRNKTNSQKSQIQYKNHPNPTKMNTL